MARGDKKYQAKKAATQKANQKQAEKEAALAEKVGQKGGAGKLSRKEIKTAKQMEGNSKDQAKGQ